MRSNIAFVLFKLKLFSFGYKYIASSINLSGNILLVSNLTILLLETPISSLIVLMSIQRICE